MEPAPQYILTDEYFQRLEPHHYRFEMREEGPVLALHRNSDQAYIGVYVPIVYSIKTESGLRGIRAYSKLPMPLQSQLELAQWFTQEDQKPF
jgi:hypothetical protein